MSEVVSATWVSVDERLPETDDRVIALYRPRKKKARVLFARYSGGAWRILERDRLFVDRRITHWMVVPRLPRRIKWARVPPTTSGNDAETLRTNKKPPEGGVDTA